jgi:hypothetical protein
VCGLEEPLERLIRHAEVRTWCVAETDGLEAAFVDPAPHRDRADPQLVGDFLGATQPRS